jgi:hypothetical protein
LPLHHLSRFQGFVSVGDSIQVTDLPGAIHLITDTPVAHIVRFFETVAEAQIRPVSPPRRIAILDQGAGD